MRKVAYSLKVRKKEKNSLVEKKYQGLCSCCEFVLTCTYHRDPGRPVLQCEEFEEIVYSPPETRNPRNPSLSNLQRKDFAPNDAFLQYKGLCKTCEERVTCTYPKPEGGVWHCEEFR